MYFCIVSYSNHLYLPYFTAVHKILIIAGICVVELPLILEMYIYFYLYPWVNKNASFITVGRTEVLSHLFLDFLWSRGRKSHWGEFQWQNVLTSPSPAAGSIAQIAVSEDSSVEEGIEWNSPWTAAVTMATDEGIKKDPEEISGISLLFAYSAYPAT